MVARVSEMPVGRVRSHSRSYAVEVPLFTDGQIRDDDLIKRRTPNAEYYIASERLRRRTYRPDATRAQSSRLVGATLVQNNYWPSRASGPAPPT